EHSRGVVSLALEVGRQLGLSAEQQRNLEFAALLHDVGKIAVPKEIINKPGSLSPEEWTVIKTHTVEGERMLSRVGGFMREVGMIVRSHHERWDGGGYPDGLAGEAIPLLAPRALARGGARRAASGVGDAVRSARGGEAARGRRAGGGRRRRPSTGPRSPQAERGGARPAGAGRS